MVSHLSRKHRDTDCNLSGQPSTEHTEETGDMIGHSLFGATSISVDVGEATDSELPDHYRLHRSAGLFLLTLREKYKLTQTAVDFAMGQVQHMVKFALEDMKEAVQHGAVSSGIELPEGIIDAMDTSVNPFEDLLTEHMQTKFFKDNFDLVVSWLVCNHVWTIIQLSVTNLLVLGDICWTLQSR